MTFEREVLCLVAQVYASKVVRALNEKEKQIVELLEKQGYNKPASNGFVGQATKKALKPAGEVTE